MSAASDTGATFGRRAAYGVAGLALFLVAWQIIGHYGLAGLAWPPLTSVLSLLGDPDRWPLLRRALSATLTLPDVGSSSEPISRRIVLLPQPDGPISATNSPAAMSSETSASAWTDLPRPSAKDLLTPSTRICAGRAGSPSFEWCPAAGRADGWRFELWSAPGRADTSSFERCSSPVIS